MEVALGNLSNLLPGLYVALLGLALAWGLKRWFEPLPLQCWAVFSIVLVVFLGPVLVGGAVLLPLDNLRGAAPFLASPPTEPHGNLLQGDLIQLIAPSAELVRDRLTVGQWPLWNHLAGAGMPLLADPQAQAFQPLVVLAYPFGSITGAAVTAALRLLTAMTFMCLLLRRRGLGLWASLAGAMAFSLGGFLTLWLGWPLANSAALLPAWLYAAELCVGRGHRSDALLLVATTSAFFLAGHPETIIYGLLFLTARLVGLFREEPRPVALWRHKTLAALVLGAVLTAPVLLPTHRYLPETERAMALKEIAPAEQALTSRESTSLQDSMNGEEIPSPPSLSVEAPTTFLGRLGMAWAPLVSPNAFGNSRYAAYWGPTNSNEDSSGFAGTATLLLVLLALAPSIRRPLPGEWLALSTVVVVLVLLALPAGWLASSLAPVPILGAVAVHGGHRALLLFNFSLATLAAGLLHRLAKGFAAKSLPRWWLATVATGLGVTVLAIYFRFPNPEDPGLLQVLRWGWVHWQLRILTAALVILFFWPRRRWVPTAFVGLIAVELYLAHHDVNPPMPKELLSPPLALKALQGEEKGGRFFALDEAMPPNTPWLYGLADLRIYNPMAPVEYQRLLRLVGPGSASDLRRLGRPDHPILDLLGARRVLTGPQVDLPSPMVRLAGDASGKLYARPKPLGRLFLPQTAALVQPKPWEQWLGSTQDFLQRTWVEDLPPGGRAAPGVVWRSASGDRDSIEITLRTPSLMSARVQLSEPRLMATSVFQHAEPAVRSGGWRLLVDQQSWSTTRANGPLLAAWLPKRAQRLDLIYRPPGFILGCLLAAVAAGLITVLWWPPPETRGQRKRGLAAPS